MPASHPVGVRIQALALLTEGIPPERVAAITQMSPRNLRYLLQKAKSRGFNPEIDPRIKIEYVEDGKRSGRPKDSSSPKGEQEQEQEQPDGFCKWSEITCRNYFFVLPFFLSLDVVKLYVCS